jgi:Capsular polysaccharide synthesis protein
MNAERIFCFWEPQGAMTPYLKLCMRTWELNVPDYEIVLLNYSNLHRYIPEGAYDMRALRKLDLMLQKDAIMVAVLRQHGGIFMDVDTIVTRDIAPIVRKLAHTEAVMFDVHMAFLAARPNSRLLTRWMKTVQERLVRLNQDDPSAPGWKYVGNSALADIMTDMISASPIGRAYDGIVKTQTSWPRWARAAWRRSAERIWARRKGVFFRTIYRNYLTMLDRKKYGFIAEAAFYGRTRMTPREQYVKFWFEEKLGVENVFSGKQRVIGLHHSWTPDWYKALSEEEVLAHGCLLSRTLKRFLKR